VPSRPYNQLQFDEPDPSGTALPSFFVIAPPLPISRPPLPISSSQWLSLLSLLDALLILVLPASRGNDHTLGGSKPIPPHTTYHQSRRH